jgi:hypothetical protein
MQQAKELRALATQLRSDHNKARGQFSKNMKATVESLSRARPVQGSAND